MLMLLALVRIIDRSCIFFLVEGSLFAAGSFLTVRHKERLTENKVLKQVLSGIKSPRSNCIYWLIPPKFFNYRVCLQLIILRI